MEKDGQKKKFLLTGLLPISMNFIGPKNDTPED